MDKRKVYCPYCGNRAKLTDSKRINETAFGLLWHCDCVPGGAFVGCHDETTVPYGRLADAELRALKSKGHALFDSIWKEGIITRNNAYALLAEKMKIKLHNCHFGMFDKQQCREAIEAVIKIKEILHMK